MQVYNWAWWELSRHRRRTPSDRSAYGRTRQRDAHAEEGTAGVGAVLRERDDYTWRGGHPLVSSFGFGLRLIVFNRTFLSLGTCRSSETGIRPMRSVFR